MSDVPMIEIVLLIIIGVTGLGAAIAFIDVMRQLWRDIESDGVLDGHAYDEDEGI